MLILGWSCIDRHALACCKSFWYDIKNAGSKTEAADLASLRQQLERDRMSLV